ncbi:Lysine biosynthesis regulatory protein LYS14 [Colletotrichum tanaceti]|uniref:Lysine biosynthesis regulatory protein LYS14 n=1 Tax=Colletotrichum tanaceti TaxID=1306861 RepID=A0A4U6XKD7_9PEZI|nr:Lysine biosynthesis regulatory protein LYS14 [Colletotrichum tanaceti]TKW56192.1 Lysine biosynthesis regulatory protein LYS14 [Colletotrichum tanaceti]
MAPQTRNPPAPALGAGGSANGGDTARSTPDTTAADIKPRRAHRKSRNGCRECKRRHVKCDETRPTCVNCGTAERHCSYLDSLPAASARSPSAPSVPAKRSFVVVAGHSPASSGGIGGGGGGNISSRSSSSCNNTLIETGGIPAVASSPSVTAVVNDFIMRSDVDRQVTSSADGQFFTLEHMRLLHHLETNMDVFMCADDLTKPLVDMNLECALNAPYLMDVLLGLSALHMADLHPDPDRADHYRHQAAQLQTRALVLFNEAKEDVSDDTCIPMFLFSSTLGAHLLCDTLRANRHDFNAFLDRFAGYLDLHRGVSAVTSRSWHVIRESGAKRFVDFLESRRSDAAPARCEVDILHRMLDRQQADLGPASLRACRDAAETLRHSYAIYRTITAERSAHQSASVMAFGVRVTTGFINVLRQRRPEALVILAFYAVLLHWCRGFWIFADAGEFLIRAVASHLGDYWSEWLAFPLSVLGGHAG